MKQRLVPAALSAIALSLALAACGETEETVEEAPVADAAEEPDVISQRQDLLEGMGDSFREIRGQLEDGSPDFAVLTTSAETIRGNAVQIIDLFPEGTSIESGADTEALPTIWEDPEGFAAAHERLVTQSEAMVEATASGDVATVEAAAMELGGACQNCHDTYRLDDD